MSLLDLENCYLLDWRFVTDLNTNIWEMVFNVHERFIDHAVHIWIFSQVQPENTSQFLTAVLDKTELQRASKFYTNALTNQYIVRRGVLRHILAAYLNCSTSELEFEYQPFGKPFLRDSAITFNLSHSAELALIAVGTSSQIGVDIEKIKSISDMERVAQHHFSKAEQETLFELTKTEQLLAFYRCWTRKEAFIKADGRGLGIPLDSFDVTLSPHVQPKVLQMNENIHAHELWQMANVPVNSDYQGAVVSIGHSLNPAFFQVHPDLLT